MDKDTSLAEKIQTLFREQGIMIASILTAIGIVTVVLVEALLPGGGRPLVGGKFPPKDERGLKEWVRNELIAGIATREIRNKICRGFAWRHWSDSQLGSQ